jgi:hypothetical protein
MSEQLRPDQADQGRAESEDGFDELVPLADRSVSRSQRKLSIAMQDGIQRRRRSSVFNLNEMTDPGGIALSRKKSIKIDPMSPGLMQPRPSMTARPSMTGASLLDANPALLGLDSRRRSSAVKLNTAAETNRKNSAFSFGPSNLPQIRACRFGETEETQDSTEDANPVAASLLRLSAVSIADSKATAPPVIKEASNESENSENPLNQLSRATLGVDPIGVFHRERRRSTVAFNSFNTPEVAESDSDESEDDVATKRARSQSIYGHGSNRRSLAKRRMSTRQSVCSIIVTAEEKNQDTDITQQKMCTFEVTNHSVEQLLKKIEDFRLENPELETDLLELHKNIKELADTTSTVDDRMGVMAWWWELPFQKLNSFATRKTIIREFGCHTTNFVQRICVVLFSYERVT